MMKFSTIFSICLVVLASAVSSFAQTAASTPLSQQEVDDDGIPVIMKHLPDWEAKYDDAKFFDSDAAFREYFSNRDIVKAISFLPGTEAAFAEYKEGNLLIIEKITPQLATEMNKNIIARSKTTSDRFLYRRIGNYGVFLFDPNDKTAGNRLLDQVKYQKMVTFPDQRPMVQFQKERDFIVGTKSLFIYTVIFILTGLGGAILIGIFAGLVYFRSMEKNRMKHNAFSDAGGLTRLNLDGFTAEIPVKRLKE